MSGCRKAVATINVAARTINLAKCLNKKGDFGVQNGPDTPAPPATQVRVCTPEQLRAMCPPDPSKCFPPLPPPTSATKKTIKSLLFVAKVLLFFGAVEWTNKLHIWDSPTATSQIAKDAFTRLAPALGDPKNDDEVSGPMTFHPHLTTMVKCVKSLYEVEEQKRMYGVTYNLATMWNKFISKCFYVIGVLPIKTYTNLMCKITAKKDEE